MSTNDDNTFAELEELEALMSVTEELKSDETIDDDIVEEEVIIASGDSLDELAEQLTEVIRETDAADNIQVDGEPLEDVVVDREDELVGAKVDGDNDDVTDKANAILAALTGKDDTTVMEMKADELSSVLTSGQFIKTETYEMLDDDAKAEFTHVEVSVAGLRATYFQRKDLFADIADEKSESDDVLHENDTDMFDNTEMAAERAAELGCSGTHMEGDKFRPCSGPAELEEARRYGKDRHNMNEDEMVKTEDFLCGFQRKSVQQPCDFCQGGCSPEDGLPGLADIENSVKSAYNAEVVGSGYSSSDDIFVVDLKRADGSMIEVFVDGEGEELGWLRLDESALQGKSAEQIEIVTKADAEMSAVTAYEEIAPDIKGEVMSVTVDVFANQDVYVVEVDGEQKSYDFYVSVQGKVLGYDEWDLIDEPTYEMTEDEEIKALEAELETKRLYSREQRQQMAESGEAMEDGSFPIADESDLRNAIMAVGRASDIPAARAHIKKRAEELGLEDMIPSDWESEDDTDTPEAEAPMDVKPVEEVKTAVDVELAAAIAEWNSMTGDQS